MQRGAAFYYVVNSCESMNSIRYKIGLTENVTCVDRDEMLAVVNKFKAEVKVVASFFDASFYS